MKTTKSMFYNQSIDSVANELNTSLRDGLSSSEAKLRLETFGFNEFQKKKGRSLLGKFFDQFKSFMIFVLILAAVISGIAGYVHGEGFTDTIIILAIVILNAIIGIIQENKAEKSLEALEKMSTPHCKVIRDGQHRTIPSRELVPGDLVVLDTGDAIPADLRLTEAVSLKIQDAALTGESVPEEKFTTAIEDNNVSLGDRDNLGFSSSVVVYGRGKGIVIGTGMQTEVGKIASMIQTAPSTLTPLQRKLDKLGKTLGVVALTICALIFFVGVFYGNSILSMLLVAVSLAAAAIPEGLPAVSTIVLSIGVQRLAKRNAIVRTLPAVETLGSTNVICTDKTGTLTQNRMTVTKLFTGGMIREVAELTIEKKLSTIGSHLVDIAVLANDAKLIEAKENQTIGDPTETALIDLGLKFEINPNALNEKYPRRYEIPFDSERKLMTTVNELSKAEFHICTKGGLDEILNCCSFILLESGITPLTQEHREKIRIANESMAKDALRVLAMAYKELKISLDKIKQEQLENNLIFVGMMGMIDPPRPEVKDAVITCRTAGIKPVMITGDHLITAKAIAEQLEIMAPGDSAITGGELEQMSDRELQNKVHHISVYARTSPEQKVRIVKAFQSNGDVVAMTGDGVNDAPALKLADIGTAMGITGTDVSKEAADIVLADDNFSTIVTAVKEGRRIYDNILKAIEFLLSTNIGELVVLFIAVMLNWVTPLLPIHILWINLVTDSLPALALSVDPADEDIMKRKPVNVKKPILSGKFSILLLIQGTMIGILALTAFRIGFSSSEVAGLSTEDSAAVARTMCFMVLALTQLTHVFNIRSNSKSAFSNMFSNKTLWGSIVLSAGLMLAVAFVPALHKIFHVTDLTGAQWTWVITLVMAPLIVVESGKLIRRTLMFRHDRRVRVD